MGHSVLAGIWLVPAPLPLPLPEFGIIATTCSTGLQCAALPVKWDFSRQLRIAGRHGCNVENRPTIKLGDVGILALWKIL